MKYPLEYFEIRGTVDLEDTLVELLEYMEDNADADADSEGFYPNKEMKMATTIKQLLYQLEKEGKI